MPLDHVVISAMRNAKSINIFMLNSSGTMGKHIDISSNGVFWVESNFEQRMMLGNYFEINTQHDNINAMELDTIDGDATVVNVGLHQINDKAFDMQTFNVDMEDLKLTFDGATACSMHCSHCCNELVSIRQFSPLTAIPICTMEPINFFCPSNKPPVILQGNELYYGLNHIVISPMILNPRVMMAENKSIHCGCCLQLVGEILSQDAAAMLFADTIRIAYERPEQGAASDTTMELFHPSTPMQVMLRLLHDALPITFDKTRLFLKTVRPDGQLHYMLLLIDTNQVHLLRSNFDLSKELDVQPASEKTVNTVTGECGNTATFLPSTNPGNDGTENSYEPNWSPDYHIYDVKMRALRGCRINYQTFCSDDELSAGHQMFMLWRENGTPMLRVSFKMMLDLVNELNVNEQMVMSLERPSPLDLDGRLSYFIFEPSNKQLNQLTEEQPDYVPTEYIENEPIKDGQQTVEQMQHDPLLHEQLQLEQVLEQQNQPQQEGQATPHTSTSSNGPQKMAILSPNLKEPENMD